MGKLLLFLSFVALLFLAVLSQVAPNNPNMWFASTALSFNCARAAIMIVLLALLVTHPPRNKIFRLFLGSLAVIVNVWVATSTFGGNMKAFDSMTLCGAAFAIGVTALEITKPLEGVDLPALRSRNQRLHTQL